MNLKKMNFIFYKELGFKNFYCKSNLKWFLKGNEFHYLKFFQRETKKMFIFFKF